MNRLEDLEHLYFALSLLSPDDEAAPILGALIGEIAAAAYPSPQTSLGVCQLDDGSRFEVDLADRLGRAFYYGFRQEQLEVSVAAAVCSSGGDRVWDIGANFGLYSVCCARRLGDGGEVHAFEPDSFASEMLTRNMISNGVTERIIVHHEALADRDGEGIFFEAEESAFSGLRDTARAKIAREKPVRLARVDTVWERLGGHPISFMKIDVEGFETEVLAGATRALTGSKDLLLMLEISVKNLSLEAQHRLAASLRSLAEIGFGIFSIDRKGGALSDFRFNESGSIPDGYTGNVYLVRRDSVRHRVLADAVRAAAAELDTSQSQREQALVDSNRIALRRYWEARETMISQTAKVAQLRDQNLHLQERAKRAEQNFEALARRSLWYWLSKLRRSRRMRTS